MTERRTSYEFEDLLSCGHGELFGPGNAQLPLPPMLMFDRISDHHRDRRPARQGPGGRRAQGGRQQPARLVLQLPFRGRSRHAGVPRPRCALAAHGVLPGLARGPGRGRALGVGEVKFTGMVVPSVSKVEYIVDLKRVILRKLKLAIADGVMKADGQVDLYGQRPARRPVRSRRGNGRAQSLISLLFRARFRGEAERIGG